MGKLIREILWALYRHLTIFINHNIRGQRHDEEFDALPEAPYLLLCNHANFLDPWYFAQYSKKPLGMMVNEDAFKTSPFGLFVRTKFLGMFPKKKGASDPKAMRETIKLIKGGYSVMIFPEGQTSWDGETQPIYPGVEKIAQKMGIPIVLHNLRGHFLQHPWWADVPRKGGVVLKRKVLSAETVKSMSGEELQTQIIDYLYNNDIKNPNNNDLTYTGENLSAGMERILWLCPECGSEDQLEMKGNGVICTACKKEYEFSTELKITNRSDKVADFYEWHQKQIELVRENLNKENGELLANDRFISLVNLDYKGRIITLDTGSLSLTPEELTFSGADGVLTFPLKDIVSPVFSEKNFLLFNIGKDEYRFVIEKSALFKWVTYLREATGYKEALERGYY